MKKQYRAALIVSGALTAVICAVMNFILIPQIETAAKGLRCFDMRFGYGYEDARIFLSVLSEQGQTVYLHRQLPLDFVYPLAYGVFFVLAFYGFLKRKSFLMAVPVLLAAADYTENICILQMLRTVHPAETLAATGSAATVTKTVLMYLCFLILLVLLIRAAAQKMKRSSEKDVTVT